MNSELAWQLILPCRMNLCPTQISLCFSFAGIHAAQAWIQGWLGSSSFPFFFELLLGKAVPARLCFEPFAAMVMGPIVRRTSDINAAQTLLPMDAQLMESNIVWQQAESLLRGSPR